MAITAAKLMVEVDGDASGAIQATSKADAAVKSLSSKLKSSFDAALPASQTLLKAVTAATTAIGGMVTQAVKWAGEQEQNLGGAKAVFGKYATDLEKIAATSYKNMGLSASDFLATANKMGSLMKGSGFETKDAMDLTVAAMQRAADVASIMGIDVNWAMESIAGAAKGNFTMMDNLGVAMNETTLNAYALEKGLGKTTQQMTTQEKVALAMQMFLERTAYAAGNYARENDTLAGSFTTMKAAFKDTASALAEGLLQPLTVVFNAITAFLKDDPAGEIKKLAPAFAVVAGAITGGILPALGHMAVAAVKAMAPLLPWMAVGAALAALIYLLVDHLGGFGAVWDMVKGALDKAKQAMQPLIDVFQDLWDNIRSQAEPMMQRFQGLWEDLKPVLEMVAGVVGGVLVVALGALSGVVGGIMGAFNGLVQMVTGALSIIINSAKMFVGLIVGIFTGDFSMLQDAVSGVLDGVVELFGGLWNAVKGFVVGFVESVIGFFKSLWQTLVGGSIVPDIINGIIDWFAQLPGKVGACVKSLVDKVVSFFNDLWSKATNTVKSLVNSVISFFSDLASKVSSTVRSLIDSVISFFAGLASNVTSTVKSLVDSVANWFSDMKTRVGDKVSEMVSSVTGKFTDMKTRLINTVSEAINSVVSWFAGLGSKVLGAIANFPSLLVDKGHALVNGLWNGAKSTWSSVQSWLGSLGSKAVSAVGNLGNKLVGAGRALIDGLWRGMKEVWNNVTSWVSGLGDWIAEHKGPVSDDAKLLRPAGLAIMQGLDQALKEGWREVERTVDAMNVTLGSTTLGAVNVSRVPAIATASSGGGNIYNITMPVEASSIRDVADLIDRLDGSRVSMRMRRAM